MVNKKTFAITIMVTIINSFCATPAFGIYENELIQAIKSKQFSLIQYYIESGANIDSKNNDQKKSALEIAKDYSTNDVVEFILKCNSRKYTTAPKPTKPPKPDRLRSTSIGTTTPIISKMIKRNTSQAMDDEFITKRNIGPTSHSTSLFENSSTLGEDLIKAVRDKDDLNLVKEIIFKHVVNIDFKDDLGQTALMYAACSGNSDIIKVLIANGANINLKNEEGKTALDIAQDYKECHSEASAEIIHLLLSSPSTATPQPQLTDETLVEAVENGNLNVVKDCIYQNIDINTFSKNGLTILMMAIRNRSDNIVKFLIENGADIYAEAKLSGETALDIANKFNKSMYKTMLSHDSEKILLYAIKKNKLDLAVDCIKFITNINVKDEDGNTALILSVLSHNKEMVELLVKNKADVAATNTSGHTALDFAKFHKYEEIINILEKFDKNFTPLVDSNHYTTNTEDFFEPPKHISQKSEIPFSYFRNGDPKSYSSIKLLDIVILGNRNSGKTALTNVLCSQPLRQGVTSHKRETEGMINSNDIIRSNYNSHIIQPIYWDVSEGNTVLEQLNSKSLDFCAAIILTLDLSMLDYSKNLKPQLINSLINKINCVVCYYYKKQKDLPPLVVVGTKSDLCKSNDLNILREFIDKKGIRILSDYNIPFLITSAKERDLLVVKNQILQILNQLDINNLETTNSSKILDNKKISIGSRKLINGFFSSFWKR